MIFLSEEKQESACMTSFKIVAKMCPFCLQTKFHGTPGRSANDSCHLWTSCWPLATGSAWILSVSVVSWISHIPQNSWAPHVTSSCCPCAGDMVSCSGHVIQLRFYFFFSKLLSRKKTSSSFCSTRRHTVMKSWNWNQNTLGRINCKASQTGAANVWSHSPQHQMASLAVYPATQWAWPYTWTRPDSHWMFFLQSTVCTTTGNKHHILFCFHTILFFVTKYLERDPWKPETISCKTERGKSVSIVVHQNKKEHKGGLFCCSTETFKQRQLHCNVLHCNVFPFASRWEAKINWSDTFFVWTEMGQ